MRVTLFRKTNDWRPEHFKGGDRLVLPSVDFEQTLAERYEDVL